MIGNGYRLLFRQLPEEARQFGLGSVVLTVFFMKIYIALGAAEGNLGWVAGARKGLANGQSDLFDRLINGSPSESIFGSRVASSKSFEYSVFLVLLGFTRFYPGVFR